MKNFKVFKDFKVVNTKIFFFQKNNYLILRYLIFMTPPIATTLLFFLIKKGNKITHRKYSGIFSFLKSF